VSRLGFVCLSIVQTLLRVLPFPCKTGLIRIGDPDRSSPVLLTCNFRLTVERVRRALRGTNAFLLVANSRGVNVWCAGTGGLLTNHDVVSVLKTSGIDALVDHRELILPQLAATGIDGNVIRKKAGWRVVWGPVEAAAIPAFLERGRKTSAEMRTVTFPWPRRLEMAVAWAFPMSLLGLLVLPFWPDGALVLVALAWGLSLVLFLAFPLYQERGAPLLVWGIFMLGFLAYSALAVDFSATQTLRWGLSSLAVVLILSLDLMGSTPVYKSGLHADRLLRITLDPERCKGAGFCEQVCPKAVFEVDHARRLASLPRAKQCVQCGACVVQCPFDALHFRSPSGDVLAPETVRAFKLNLAGKRLVRAEEIQGPNKVEWK
jgi:NAD-dependent dihydropyrimidine dehydrogenase PreA subunit